jgi:DNA-binding HxlR family transcriptional regulator
LKMTEVVRSENLMVEADHTAGQATQEDSSGLSYKFQRLREKLRLAVASGELAGKLPGERTLARRFHVNAKTLSKALTDLAAEGLLERSIGRGTFVKGSAPSAPAGKRLLVLCHTDQTGWEIIQLLRNAEPELEVLTDIRSVRPSFLNQFNAVIDIAPETPDTFIRDLVVRNIPVVVVGKAPRTYSTHSVAFDGQLGVSLLARELLLGGHRHVAAIEPSLSTVVAHGLRQAVARYAPDATIEAGFAEDAIAMVGHGITAFVCQNVELSMKVKSQLQNAGIQIPQRVSVVAVGSTSGEHPISGYFMSRAEKVSAILQLLRQQNSRPSSIWLAGQFVDRGTMAPVASKHSNLIVPNHSDRTTDSAA